MMTVRSARPVAVSRSSSLPMAASARATPRSYSLAIETAVVAREDVVRGREREHELLVVLEMHDEPGVDERTGLDGDPRRHVPRGPQVDWL